MRPVFLLLDADVTFQLFIGKVAKAVLDPLRKSYGLRAIVVPEVEIELRSHRRLGATIGPLFVKACGSGLIKILDADNYSDLLGLVASTTSHASIQSLGRQYNYRVDRGEAYTHATGVSLSQPVASNDMNAVRTLRIAGEELPRPVLRTFDLIVFANQIGALSDADCDDLRKSLNDAGEGLPQAWEHASYIDGLSTFVPRLIDPHLVPRATGTLSRQPPPFAEALALSPIASND